MIKTSLLSIILNNSERTIQRWKKEERPIIKLLDKYFSDSDLKEFLDTGRILSLDEISIYKNLSNYCTKHLSNDLIFLFDNNHKYSDIHPLYVLFDFIINNSKPNFNDIEFVSDNSIFYDTFQNEYFTFVINSKIDPIDIKKLLDIDLDLIYILCRHKNSLNQFFDNVPQIKVFLIFYSKFQEIEIENKDFFIKYFNLAVIDYIKFNHMMVNIDDIEQDYNKITILKNINDIFLNHL